MKNNSNCKNGNRGKSYKTNRTSTKFKSGKTETHMKDGYVPEVYNDASWYARNPDALQASTKLSMNLAAGQAIYPFLRNYVNPDFEKFQNKYSFPGVARFEYVVALGSSSASTDAINLASQRLFKDLRKQNTGSTAYDPSDLMMYILAMDQIYSLYAWMVRAYKTVNYYNSRNRNVPDVLLRAMNIDPTIGQDLATFRYWLINFKARLDSWNVPGNIDFIKRHYWLNSHIYKDQDTVKAALFFFDQRFWLRWTENVNDDETTNFALNPVYLLGTGSDGKLTFSDLATLMTDMLRDIETSQDFSIINGDILKVFDKSVCFSVSVPSENDIIEPQYNEEIALQVKNAIICGYPQQEDKITNGRVYQDFARGIIKQDLYVSPRVADLNPIISFDEDVPSSDTIMVSTRLVPHITYDGSVPGAERGIITAAGSDLITCVTTYRKDAETGDILSTDYQSSVVSTLGQITAEMVTQIAIHPLYYVTDPSATVTTTHEHPIKHVIGDIDNYTVMGPAQLRNLHETAMFSLFNVF